MIFFPRYVSFVQGAQANGGERNRLVNLQGEGSHLWGEMLEDFVLVAFLDQASKLELFLS